MDQSAATLCSAITRLGGGASDLNDRAIQAKAEVLYSHLMEGGAFREPGMGMRFTDISEDDRLFVRHFIKERLTADLAICS